MSRHTEDQLTKIKDLLIKLKAAHLWIQKHQDKTIEIEGLINRSEPIINELEQLGVSRDFAQALLIFGPVITNSLVDQFQEDKWK